MSLYACSSETAGPDLLPDGEENVIFVDDFSSFNSNVWNKETHPSGWTNEELQSYSPDNVTTGKDGNRTVLILTAENKNGRIISGRVNSKGKKAFKYGKIEASIKLPKTANGLWPAFWMMGNNSKEWPACGEIDIMEMGDSEGIRNKTTSSRVNTAIHYGINTAGHEQQYFAADFGKNLQDGDYHTYTMEWDEKNIRVLIDGTLFNTFSTSSNPYFHDEFFILFNLAVGGTFTGITDLSDITALKNGQKAAMYIDWIKITKNN